MSTESPDVRCQKAHIIPKGSFNNMLNPAAGPGRVILKTMIDAILGLTTGTCFPSHPPVPDPDANATAKNWVILHRIKERNEEVFIRLTDDKKRPASEFSHYPIALFDEIIKTRYNPSGVPLEPPVSFTFYLAFRKANVPDVIFSARFPTTADSGVFVDLFYGLSGIPGITNGAITRPGLALGAESGAGSGPAPMAAPPYTIDDEACETVAASHSIRPEVFHQYVTNYWEEQSVPAPFSISWQVLESLIKSNIGMQIRLLWVNDNTNNMDLGFEPDPYYVPPTLAAERKSIMAASIPEKTSYSFQLFNGISKLSNPSYQIRLYKGRTDNNLQTILIESVGGNGHSYFDLNSLHP